MKHGIFISYSDLDRQKVQLFERELIGNNNFTPKIIAFDREALKPLAQKVADGIIESEVIVPIITSNSISTQWINQEIGFASALKKKIMPIVDISIISELKGFIHKQIDLPYGYNPHANKAIENKDFVKQVRNLLSDLDKVYNTLVSVKPSVQKTDFENILEQADRRNEELNFQKHRKQFLSSHEGIKAANNEVMNIFTEIESKMQKLQEKKVFCSHEKSVQYPLVFIVKCDGFSFSIAWQQDYDSVFEGARLIVRFWKGYTTLDSPGRYPPSERAVGISENQFLFDINRNDEISWYDKSNNKSLTSSQLVVSCFKWLIDQVSNKNLN